MRAPSDLYRLFEYWRLALVDMAAAERFRVAHEWSLSLWPDLPAVFPGFYRRKSRGLRNPEMAGKMIPIAIWCEQPIEDGELVGEERIIAKWGRGLQATTIITDPLELVSLFHACRRAPVTEDAYRWALAHDNQWADTRAPAIAPSRPAIEILEQRSIF